MADKIRFEVSNRKHALEIAKKYSYEWNEISEDIIDIIVDDNDNRWGHDIYGKIASCLWYHLEPEDVLRCEEFDSEEDYERFSEEIREEMREDDDDDEEEED